MTGSPPASVATDVAALALALREAPRVALDVESDGMFAYRAGVCAVQLAAGGSVSIVDALATPLTPLGPLLGDAGPIKIVHDVAFDARILAEAGIVLGNVHDTAIAARMLGRTATGLASMAASELGVTLDKSLQHHDWRERPLLEPQLAYLAGDVMHLEALEERLWRELTERGIDAEVDEETRYRVGSAVEAAREDPEPARAIAYGFAKGFDKLNVADRAVFRRLWLAREDEARTLDVPPGRLIPTEVLLVLTRRKPRAARDVAAVRLSRRAEEMTDALVEAVVRGVADGAIPEDERARIEPPRPSRDVIARARRREKALSAWRQAEAKARGVDEQVVLPGHCLKDLAGSDAGDAATVATTPGFGACRARYAEPIAVALAAAAENA